jgi:hypothetical protein
MTEEVRTNRITLVNEDGKVRASMFVDEHDRPVVALMDKKGTTRARVSVDSGGYGAALQFLDEDGKETVTLREDAGEPFLILGEEESHIFLRASVRGPRVTFSNKPEVRVEDAKEVAEQPAPTQPAPLS